MKLINVLTLAIETFNTEHQLPRYAILSHTWGLDEVSHQEWLVNANDPPPEYLERAGYTKIIQACSKTRDDRLRYLWVDTVCIDKTSSSELSEAINSMFKWYERANVCLVHLADVEWTPGLVERIYANEDAPFRSSRWFTRGWTLQELLAPSKVFFFTADWREIGTKSELRFRIAHITGIDVTYLGESRKIWSASLSARMSWASGRETTRQEDAAYCLLGIFDINMPLLYGEGTRAFMRLQEEIIRASDDHTIFCWGWDPERTPGDWQSVLAPSPAVFAGCSTFVATRRTSASTPYHVTNMGLRMKLPVVAAVNSVCAMLSVISTEDPDPDHKRRMCLPLMAAENVYRRCPFPSRPFPVHRNMVCERKDMYILYRLSRNTEDLMPWPYRHQFQHCFNISILDASFSTSVIHQRVTSIDCLVPQYRQTPSSHVSMPVYSAVGFRSALEHVFNGLVLRITYRNEVFLVLLYIQVQDDTRHWGCRVLDPTTKFADFDVPMWLTMFENHATDNELNRVSTDSHTQLSKGGKTKISVILDQQIRDEAGRAVQMVYLKFGEVGNGSSRDVIVWDEIRQSCPRVKTI
ncbi:Vegetative incompatibility protein HET-E-1 [Colletotrichum trifolii]|uniref:Vegetative incompatibility protein HET-E-1 n=1 Tax=Colletotrichum trifolii TaxID=5466 RepID=A0A4V3HSF9_COLTR|nr:Vegetative incompatibility protein HET-E-1 [Colletotrichum trifolii]